MRQAKLLMTTHASTDSDRQGQNTGSGGDRRFLNRYGVRARSAQIYDNLSAVPYKGL